MLIRSRLLLLVSAVLVPALLASVALDRRFPRIGIVVATGYSDRAVDALNAAMARTPRT